MTDPWIGLGEIAVGGLLSRPGEKGGSAPIERWLASSTVDADALAQELEERRSNGRKWQPRDSGVQAILWLHLARHPAPLRLVSDVADALSAAKGVGLSESVDDHLEARARAILESAASRAWSRGSDALRDLLSEAELKVANGDVEFGEGLSVSAISVLEAFGERRFGLVELRSRIVGGAREFDAIVEAGREVRRETLHDELAGIVRGESGPSVTRYLECFPFLLADVHVFGILLDALARSARMDETEGRVLRETELLRLLGRMMPWTGEALGRLVSLEAIALRNPGPFFEASVGAIARVWDKDRATSTYAALCLGRILRVLETVGRDDASVTRAERMDAALAGLADGHRTLWLLRRLGELDFGLHPEEVAWANLDGGAKAHWSWLVFEHAKDDAELADALIRFSMKCLPKETYAHVEPLIVELAHHAGRWDTIDRLAEGGEGVAMLRAGYLRRRRNLNRLPGACDFGFYAD